ncbi:MAG: hypothetical protein UD936_09085 [Acutalibacteraceae bacterium]|nr:hypothetical protein [Acutalibacteraceae bacterium]
MKRNAITGLITGLLLTVVGFGVSNLIQGYDIARSVTMVDGEKIINWYSYLYYIMVTLALFGIAVAITACFCLVFKNTVSASCKFNTSAFSIVLSALAGMGLFCLFLFASCFAFTDPKYHPITFPSSFILGSISFLVFIALLFKYVKLKKYNLSVKAIAIDVLFSLLYVIPFFVLYNTLASLLRDCLHIAWVI